MLRGTLHPMYVTRAIVRGDLGDHHEAVVAWTQAVDLGDMDDTPYRLWYCHANRGFAHWRLGDYQRAVAELALAFRLCLAANDLKSTISGRL